MTRILIVEANTPTLVSRGLSGSWPFVRTLAAIEPQAEAILRNPFAKPLNLSDLDAIDGVIFTGGAEKWAVTAPEVAPQRYAMDLVLSHRLPVWGSCNGMQLAALALGGTIAASKNGLEVGVAKHITLTNEGANHAMMSGRCSTFAAPCVHRDHIAELPSQATLLAGNAHTRIQAFAINSDGVDVWATQYHPELGLSDVVDYIEAGGMFGLFFDHLQELRSVAEDPNKANRIGATPADLAFENRTREFTNWLRHVEALRLQRDAA